MRIFQIMCLFALLCSCAQTRRLERKEAVAGLSLVTRAEAEPDEEPYRPNWTKVKKPFSSESLYFGEAVFDSAGNRRMLVRLQPVEVVAKRRVIVERLGRVMIGFRVRVPRELQSRCFGIELLPVLHRQDTSLALAPLVIRGGLFADVQNRSEWRYDKYRHWLMGLGAQDTAARLDRARRLLVRFPQTGAARLDSVAERPRQIDYFYSQDVPAPGNSGQLFVTLQGRVRALDGSIYGLPPSDTMRYTVSSMLSFVDTTQRFVKRIVRKYAEVRDRSYLSFPVNGTAIIDTLGDNGPQLARITATMDSLINHSEFYVDSVALTASSSPEGSYAHNALLAERRARSLKGYLTDRFGREIDTLIAVRWVAEDWDGLRKLIAGEEGIAHRSEILKLIAQRTHDDGLESEIRRCYPEDYALLRRKLYPRLRAVDFRYSLRRRDMVQDTVVTAEPDTLYSRAVEMLKHRDYAPAMYLLESYHDRNYALALLSLGYDALAREVLEPLPQDPERDYMLAIVCARLGARDEALMYYRRAAETEPRYRFRAKLDPELSGLVENL